MEQDSPKTASAAELADLLDKSDRAHIDVLGGALHTLAHPIESGALGVAVAAITVPLTGFGYIANNFVRLRLAAGRRKDVVDEIMKHYSHGAPPPAAP
jgi:hypothetical protein